MTTEILEQAIDPYPLVKEISFVDPLQLFAKLQGVGSLFLDSARQDAQGKHSFIAFDPFQWLTCKNGWVTLGETSCHGDPFTILQTELTRFNLRRLPDLPPFQGGVAGLFGYELGHYLEKLPLCKKNDMQVPELAVGFYDLVLAFDHQQQRAWLFSSGFPAQEEKRAIRAQERLEWALCLVHEAQPLKETAYKGIFEQGITSTFNKTSYVDAVERVIEYIRAGDIFEANISQRFSAPRPADFLPFELYRVLRQINSAPFAAYLQGDEFVIASASPERFLRLNSGKVETRPIKGTRPRLADEQKNQQLMDALVASEKDRAENIMIVDLMRNDLSRVCLPHTVNVPKLCGLETFATVHHLVSVVEGQMQPDKGPVDLLRATFPGGSITGAPKIRAMEIIGEIEPLARGPYCGSIGYIGFNQEMDLSILIRTFVINKERIAFQTGGAITVDSDPVEEYEETLTKAAALRRALIQ